MGRRDINDSSVATNGQYLLEWFAWAGPVVLPVFSFLPSTRYPDAVLTLLARVSCMGAKRRGASDEKWLIKHSLG